MSATPLVSICVSSYNSALYLRATLDSIAAQSYPNLEVIVSDNASTDDSVAIAREYREKFGFQVLAHRENLGPFGNWNTLIARARGEFVALYHSDDVYEPTMVEEAVAALNRHPEAGLVGTLATVIDENGTPCYPIGLPEGVSEAGPYGFTEVLRAVLGNGGRRIFLVTPSIMVRRRLYAELGGFDTSGRFRSSGDYEMWLRIAARHPVAVIPRPLMRYRVHEAQGSERELRRNVELPDILAVLDHYVPRAADRELEAAYRRYRDRACLKTALKLNCRNDFQRSIETAGQIEGGPYRPLGGLLALACRLHLNLRCWPGRPWPCRVNLETQ